MNKQIDSKSIQLWQQKNEQYIQSTIEDSNYFYRLNRSKNTIKKKFDIESKEPLQNDYKTLVILFATLIYSENYCFNKNAWNIKTLPIKSDKNSPMENTFSPLILFFSKLGNKKDFLRKIRDNVQEALEQSSISSELLADLIAKKKYSPFDFSLYFNRVHNIANIEKNDSESGCELFFYQKNYHTIQVELKMQNVEADQLMLKGFIESFQKCFSILTAKEDVNLDIAEISNQDSKEIKWLPLDCKPRISDNFEDIAKKYPNKIALSAKNRQLSFFELNEAAEKIKYQLLLNMSDESNTVAIFSENSIETVISILGVLKAGQTFVPIDINLPIERIKLILADANIKLVLFDSCSLLEKGINFVQGKELSIEACLNIELTSDLQEIPKIENELAYFIYTTGTTGKPKGVKVTHQNVLNLIFGSQKNFQFSSSDKWILLHSFSFDFSIWELFGSLLYGSEIYIPNLIELKDTQEIVRVIWNQKITVLNITPSFYYYVMLDDLLYESIRYIIFGGEKLNFGLINEQVEKYQFVSFINMYGITETTVHVTFKKIDSIMNPSESIIGKPLPNYFVDIVNLKGQQLPVGFFGEMIIGGFGVSSGYNNLPEKNKEAFFRRNGMTYYKSGDIARYTAGEELEYLERKDAELKVRGYRLNKDEITYLVNLHPKIENSYLLKENDNLVLFYKSELEIKVSEIKNLITTKLPSYCLPTKYIVIQEFPLNRNKKIDEAMLRKSLESHSQVVSSEKTKTIQEELMIIWQAILESESRLTVESDFFEIGGHSLNAAFLSYEINKHFATNLEVIDIFNHTTIKQQTILIEKTKEDPNSNTLIGGKEENKMIPPNQDMYWEFILDKKSTKYNIPNVFKIEGNINLEKLCKSINDTVNQHVVFSSIFEINNQEVHQKRGSFKLFTVDVVYFEGVTDEEKQQLFAQFIIPFDLNEERLVRAKIYVFKEDNQKNVFLLTDFHHIIVDGISIKLLLAEFLNRYDQNQIKQNLPAIVQQTADQINQNELAQEFWLKELKDWTYLSKIPAINLEQLVGDEQNNVYQQDISMKTANKVKYLAKKLKTTEFNVLFAAFSILVARYNFESKGVIGVPVSGRDRFNTNAIGNFVNVIPAKYHVSQQESFSEYVDNLTKWMQKSLNYQSYPLQNIISDLDITRNGQSNPLFSIVFSFTNLFEECFKTSDFYLREIGGGNRRDNKFDFHFDIVKKADSYQIEVEYNLKLYEEEMIATIVENFLNILKNALNSSEIKISKLSEINEAELVQLRTSHAQSQLNSDDYHDTIFDLFKKQAMMKQYHAAIIDEQGEMTYQELFNQVMLLSERLVQIGFKAKDVLLVDCSSVRKSIAVMLACNELGGIFVPIHESFSNERIELMATISKAKFVVFDQSKQSTYQSELLNNLTQILFEDTSSGGASLENSFKQKSCPNAIVQYIFTSGTTGNPKCVPLTNKNIISLTSQVLLFGISPDDVVSQAAPLTFDAGMFEWVFTLTNGLTLNIIHGDSFNKENWIAAFQRKPITFSWLTSSLFNTFVDQDISFMSELKHLIVGGEQLSETHVYEAKQVLTTTKIMNGYGPTENSIFSTLYEFTKPSNILEEVLIGQAIPGRQAYIMLQDRPCGINVPGEIVLSGYGLSQGYLNDPDLTKRKYYRSEFFDGMVLYRTGDIGYLRKDKNIKYLFRRDNQVKVNGYRVELEEIEKALLESLNCNASKVLVREISGIKMLIAYFTHDQIIDEKKMKTLLNKSLPKYMIPSSVIQVSQMHLTSNGKLDIEALIKESPINEKLIQQEEFLYPEISNKLLLIFEELLQKRVLDTKSNFFELGCTSLLATLFATRIQEEFDIEFELASIFEYPTFDELANLIKASPKRKNIIQNVDKKFYSLSKRQEELWIAAQLVEDNSMNINAFLSFKNLDVAIFEQVIAELIERHEVLRTRFEENNEKNSIVQIINKCWDLNNYFTFINQNEAKQGYPEFISTIVKQKIDVEAGALFHCYVYEVSKNSHEVIFIMHHIIGDAWSLRILLKEISQLYNAKKENHKLSLAHNEIRYVDYAEWEQQENINYANNEEFWNKELHSLPVFALPEDYPRKNKMDNRGESIEAKIKSKDLQLIKELAKKMRTSEYNIVFTFILILLKKQTYKDEIIVGTIDAGRDNAQVKNLVGYFLMVLPFRIKLEDDSTFIETMKMVIDKQNQIRKRNKYPYIEMVKNNSVNVEGYAPLFNILIQYIDNGENGSKVEFSGANCQINNIKSEQSKYDLVFNFIAENGQLDLQIEYSTNLYQEETINQLIQGFSELLNAIRKNEQILIADLKIDSPKIQKKIVKRRR